MTSGRLPPRKPLLQEPFHDFSETQALLRGADLHPPVEFHGDPNQGVAVASGRLHVNKVTPQAVVVKPPDVSVRWLTEVVDLSRVVHMETGKAIKAWRDYRGLSQEKLGERAGITRQTVYVYESGRSPNVKILDRIIAALGLSSVDEFRAGPPEEHAVSQRDGIAKECDTDAPREVHTVALPLRRPRWPRPLAPQTLAVRPGAPDDQPGGRWAKPRAKTPHQSATNSAAHQSGRNG